MNKGITFNSLYWEREEKGRKRKVQEEGREKRERGERSKEVHTLVHFQPWLPIRDQEIANAVITEGNSVELSEDKTQTP